MLFSDFIYCLYYRCRGAIVAVNNAGFSRFEEIDIEARQCERFVRSHIRIQRGLVHTYALTAREIVFQVGLLHHAGERRAETKVFPDLIEHDTTFTGIQRLRNLAQVFAQTGINADTRDNNPLAHEL
ncbi:hypothetical protein D3C87_1713150 [compost metagenome]